MFFLYLNLPTTPNTQYKGVYRAFMLDKFKVYDDSGKATIFWTLEEHWYSITDKFVHSPFGDYYEKANFSVPVLIFDSNEEANSFIKILIEVLTTCGENETCAVLSRYIREKLLRANPE